MATNKALNIPMFDHVKFLSKIIIRDECWEWQGALMNKGYGTHYVKGKGYLAHRLSYSIFNNLSGARLVIDHNCMNRKCVNPDHLREVTRKINNTENNNGVAALNKIKTHCKRGHGFTLENTYNKKGGTRECLTCKSEQAKIRYKQTKDIKVDNL